jgi:L-aminopeptidase/D-esterase-like protein
MGQGRIGAGCGATVGKLLGMERSMPGGIGMAAIRLAGGAMVAAVVAVNAVGDALDYRTNEILAGVRLPDGSFPGAQNILIQRSVAPPLSGGNTTIGAVVTDAALTKAQAARLASSAHDGIAWAIRPAHTTADGDTIFALSLGNKKEEMMVLCAAAAEVTARAIANAVTAGER